MESKKRIAVILVLILVLVMMAGCRVVAPVKEEEALERPIPPEERIPEARPPAPLPGETLGRVVRQAGEIIEERRREGKEVPREAVVKLEEAKKAMEKGEYARVQVLCEEIRDLLFPEVKKAIERPEEREEEEAKGSIKAEAAQLIERAQRMMKAEEAGGRPVPEVAKDQFERAKKAFEAGDYIQVIRILH